MIEKDSNFLPVSVIASFDTKGHITPIYFRYNNEPIRVNVISIKINVTSISFKCNYYIEELNTEKTMTLFYRLTDHIWCISKNE